MQRVERAQLSKQYPQLGLDGIEFGVLQPTMGAIMARRGVQTLVKEFVAEGGVYKQLAIQPPKAGAALDAITSTSGETVRAKQFVFACGPWLPKLFPDVIGTRIVPTRKEVFFFAPEPGDTSFNVGVNDFVPGYGYANPQYRSYNSSQLVPGTTIADQNYSFTRTRSISGQVFGLPAGRTVQLYVDSYDAVWNYRRFNASTDASGLFTISALAGGTTYLADGYARASGRPGVAFVVPGVGIYNAGAGLATAFASSAARIWWILASGF